MKIQFTVKREKRFGVDCVGIYAEFKHVEPPPFGEVKTMQKYAELFKVDDVVVWTNPLRNNLPIHVLKVGNMDEAIEQTKEIIRKHITEKYS